MSEDATEVTETTESPPKPAPAKKTTRSPRNLPLTDADLAEIDKVLDAIPTSPVVEKLRQFASSGEAGAYLFADDSNLSVLHAVMGIIRKWQPETDRDGAITDEQQGDFNDIDELSRDSLYIDTLNTDLGAVMGKLNAQAEAAKLEIDLAKSQLRVELRKIKKQPKYRGKITDDLVTELSRVNKRFTSAVSTWVSINELARVVSSVYFSAQRISDKLADRVKTLLSDWGRQST